MNQMDFILAGIRLSRETAVMVHTWVISPKAIILWEIRNESLKRKLYL
jgi:hypothetical protein